MSHLAIKDFQISQAYHSLFSKFTALLVVDLQNDFCEGGVLGIDGTSSLIPKVNQLIELAHKCGSKIIYTQDWHPKNHQSFSTEGGPWPEHCVAGTHGAALSPELHIEPSAIFFKKGIIKTSEGYSAFEDGSLLTCLKTRNINKVVVCGVATSFCVAASAKDAASHGIETYLALDYCLDIPSDSAKDLPLISTQEFSKTYNIKLIE